MTEIRATALAACALVVVGLAVPLMESLDDQFNSLAAWVQASGVLGTSAGWVRITALHYLFGDRDGHLSGRSPACARILGLGAVATANGSSLLVLIACNGAGHTIHSLGNAGARD